ncbi:hypothetical protein V5R04_07130 [Jonesiaceae bacterium BS-20]|uniref:Lactococcin 972 family bacteriocin n=1 Tax=Jonesiaceae bacterium BS-20 TaxID=3120821 RepID=A0AAU7DZM1_9MICO
MTDFKEEIAMTIRKWLSSAGVLVMVAVGAVTLGAAPASADSSGSRYCSSPGRPFLFTYSTMIVEHQHTNSNKPSENYKVKATKKGNYTTSASWSSDLWKVYGTASQGTPQTYCN